MFKYFRIKLRGYIFIILTATILLIFSCTKSFTQENIFIVNKVEVEGIGVLSNKISQLI